MNSKWNVFYIFLFILILASCEKRELMIDDSRFGDKIMILGHMGMGVAYSWPANSKESVLASLEIGCDGAEIDVQLSLDSVLVAYHDAGLNTQTKCNGQVYNSYWDDLKSCSYNRALRSSDLLSIEDLFASITNPRDYYFSLDCKIDIDIDDMNEYQYRLLREIKRLCALYDMEDRVFIEGTQDLLLKAQEMGIKNRLCLLAYTDISSNIDTCVLYGFFGVSVPEDTPEELMVEAFTKDIRCMAWAPDNYSENKKLLEKRPDIFQTDDPVSLLKLLNRYNYEAIRP